MQMEMHSSQEDWCPSFEQFSDLVVLCLIYAVKLHAHITY